MESRYINTLFISPLTLVLCTNSQIIAHFTPHNRTANPHIAIATAIISASTPTVVAAEGGETEYPAQMIEVMRDRFMVYCNNQLGLETQGI
jgi:hypothetical protein